MPGGDQTGPMGMGAMTGWGRGACGGAEAQGFGRGGWGRGGGRGRGGGGWGRRNQYWATGMPGWMRGGAWDPPTPLEAEPPAEMKRTWLEQRTSILESELEWIKRRKTELDDARTADE